MLRALTLVSLTALCRLAVSQQTVVELINLPGFGEELSASIVGVKGGLTTYDLACATSSSDCELIGHATCVLGETTWSATATHTTVSDSTTTTFDIDYETCIMDSRDAKSMSCSSLEVALISGNPLWVMGGDAPSMAVNTLTATIDEDNGIEKLAATTTQSPTATETDDADNAAAPQVALSVMTAGAVAVVIGAMFL